MPHFLTLRGGQALSEFRLEKLNSRLNEFDRTARISEAVYLHFAESGSALDASALQVLHRLLEYGDASAKSAPKGELVLVVPRIGTISPGQPKPPTSCISADWGRSRVSSGASPTPWLAREATDARGLQPSFTTE